MEVDFAKNPQQSGSAGIHRLVMKGFFISALNIDLNTRLDRGGPFCNQIAPLLCPAWEAIVSRRPSALMRVT